MVPLNTFTPTPVISAFQAPLTDVYAPLTMRCSGGVAIGDGSQGRLTQYWTVSYDPLTSLVSIVPESTGASTTLTITGVLTICLAFDNNMAVVLSYMKADGGYLYYFDSLSHSYQTLHFSTITSCRVAVDDAQPFYNAASDVIFAYVANGLLKYRQQRDRYTIEYSIGSSTNTLIRLGPSVNNRLQLELVVPGYEEIDPYVTDFSNGAASTGKRYFEILVNVLTDFSNMGISIGRTDFTIPLKIGAQFTDRWIGFSPMANSTAVYYTDNGATSYSTSFDTSSWGLNAGDVVGFAVDMGAGTLDKVYVNGTEVPILPSNSGDYAVINAWTPDAVVRPFFYGVPNTSMPYGSFTLRETHSDIEYLPDGYIAWDGSYFIPASITLNKNTVDLFVDPLTDNEWSQLSVKGTVATFPTKYYNDGDYPLNGINVWPVPNTEQAVTAWLWEPLSNLTNLDIDLNMPKGYERAVRFGLAVELAAEYGKTVPPMVQKTADASKSVIKRLNNEPQIMAGDIAIAPEQPFNYLYGDTLAN